MRGTPALVVKGDSVVVEFRSYDSGHERSADWGYKLTLVAPVAEQAAVLLAKECSVPLVVAQSTLAKANNNVSRARDALNGSAKLISATGARVSGRFVSANGAVTVDLQAGTIFFFGRPRNARA